MSQSDMVECKICKGVSNFFADGKIMNRYNVKYYHCSKCGFIQTEEPYWLSEAYDSAITKTDIGILSRNNELVKKTSALINTLFPEATHMLDYGAGYGIFVRLMRDAGFDFEWSDKYCENIFAKGHEQKEDHYDIVTAFELLEHLDNPLIDIKKILSLADTVICTTLILPNPTPCPGKWWYYSMETGQHVSFYTYKAMDIIAKENSFNYTGYDNVHVFSKKKISTQKMKSIIKWSWIINRIKKRPSLLSSDYNSIVGKSLM